MRDLLLALSPLVPAFLILGLRRCCMACRQIDVSKVLELLSELPLLQSLDLYQHVLSSGERLVFHAAASTLSA